MPLSGSLISVTVDRLLVVVFLYILDGSIMCFKWTAYEF